MEQNYFLKMLEVLRQQEEIMLFGNILSISDENAAAAIVFLRREYWQESFGYPYQAPLFDANAALWAAKTVYIAAQLILYRAHKEEDLDTLFNDFEGNISAATVLSADLCLRFLPDLLIQIKLIDSEDKLIGILQKILEEWHYSGIKYALDIEKLNFKNIENDPCILQMYLNRVIHYKKVNLSKHPSLEPLLRANLGIFGKELFDV